jgi:hypothetical protein
MAHYDALIALELPHGFPIIEHLAQACAFELQHYITTAILRSLFVVELRLGKKRKRGP